ncbi:hypothetical protein SPRG_21521 [Saprolegnia parasitica CBS 223.65]|uniref:Uncharacterized protein n=1 Tax=Saprolegnia parasitica (strain CBS 223.65) TaxID=695850 RepID=A0A067BLD8_SAPPC|nr:hypothetical protein SPRG_21521 [Saprolegnia parasitica CBS 223.65]KDO19284.1 hypothetical protein SPRG_21521 [Saprolegnia parasitica CBS 223.65]|eukprot:XP_012209995.1 hypothetical protein SPRG_21521 [Saprolegnia parasitica CBS 223.65]
MKCKRSKGTFLERAIIRASRMKSNGRSSSCDKRLLQPRFGACYSLGVVARGSAFSVASQRHATCPSAGHRCVLAVQVRRASQHQHVPYQERYFSPKEHGIFSTMSFSKTTRQRSDAQWCSILYLKRGRLVFVAENFSAVQGAGMDSRTATHPRQRADGPKRSPEARAHCRGASRGLIDL